MGEFRMPTLGADMESGRLLKWYVKPGDRVRRGDVVALVDTSKAEIDVEIFEDGVIDEQLVAEGARVPVGTVLATVLSDSAAARSPAVEAPAAIEPPAAPAEPPAAPAEPPAAPAEPPAAPAEPPAAPAEPPAAIEQPAALQLPALPPADHRRHASPVARRAAAQLGVNLAAVTGTGPGGAIIRADVERAAAEAAGQPAPPGASPVPSAPPQAPSPPPAVEPAVSRQQAMREAIAALMARSKREIPHYYLQLEIDLSAAMQWLHEANLARPVQRRLLASALLLSAVAHATAETPEMNGFWIDGAFHPGSGVHLGVAISLRGGGLIAPALHDADLKTVDEIMDGVRDLVARARSGRMRGSEMSDPTITVTNLGDRGVDLVHGVIYPPQVALVGFGSVRERPCAVDGMLGVRPTVIATLAADHRSSDGHAGGRFLSLIDQNLRKPETL